ncbi:MAG: hypothetical protein K0R83_1627 [Caulobacter sp.]|nr:hypothetical protein [Caulobacter sp.]
MDVAVLAGGGDGDLALEVEVILAADGDLAGGAARAWGRVSAATANRDWPTYCTRPSANSGSSPITGLTSFLPGMSAAQTTSTTPGAARTADRSIETSRAWARGLMAMKMCSRFEGSGRSSM